MSVIVLILSVASSVHWYV